MGGGRWGTPRRGPGSLARPPCPSPGFKPGLGRRKLENWPGAAAASLIAHRPSWWGAQTRLPGVLGLVRPDAVTPAGGPPDRLRARPPSPGGPQAPRLPSSGIGCQARVPGTNPPTPTPTTPVWSQLLPTPRPEEDPAQFQMGRPDALPTHPLPHTPSPKRGLPPLPKHPAVWKASIPVWSQMKD